MKIVFTVFLACYHDKILANKSKVAAAVPVENRPESRKSILHNDNMLKRKAKIVDVARTDLSKARANFLSFI